MSGRSGIRLSDRRRHSAYCVALARAPTAYCGFRNDGIEPRAAPPSASGTRSSSGTLREARKVDTTGLSDPAAAAASTCATSAPFDWTGGV